MFGSLPNGLSPSVEYPEISTPFSLNSLALGYHTSSTGPLTTHEMPP